GNLYEARAALTEASKVNARFVEFDDLSQNWRRIEFNLVQVDLDRGKIEQAEERLRDIEAEVSALAEKFFSDDMRKRWTKPYGSVRDYVLDWYTEPTHDGRPSRVDSEVPTEIITLLGMIQGYRGIFQHLRGALAASKVSLRCSVAILQRLNEQRAYAFFQRHLASLLIASGEVEQACAALQLCIAAAGPLRQTDIDHSGRVALVQYRLRRSPLTTADLEGKPIPQLHETLRYATSSDMYRLQVETMQALALVHLGNGDVDSALQFTTDAMAISSRCGFGLRKVNLRTLLARVLALRGDTRSARALVLSSSVIASKIHYERAVETAENLLLELNSGNAPN
ncbi:MAG TPA: hypothetical protein VK980_00430, partial [Sphingomonas sp.]|nr:hypothetical protein [Sphingomonas sp.]